MALLGKAALAMWWDMAPDVRAEFEHWHTHEHFPERLGIPGFLRASRWRSVDGEGFFVMYELQGHEVLSSPRYLAHLNAPSPWSARMMPHHRHIIRNQCRVLESRGGGVARHALTIHLSPAPGQALTLRGALKPLFDEWAMRPGLIGAHLLAHEAPEIATTTEQKIRGGDRAGEWVVVVCAYELTALQTLAAGELGAEALVRMGAGPGASFGYYGLCHAAVAGDVG